MNQKLDTLDKQNSSIDSKTSSIKPWSSLQPVPTLVPWTTRLSIALRIKFFLTGVLFPIICLAVVLAGGKTGIVHTPWQSGEWLDHYIVFLSSPTITAFFPLLLFSFVCLSLWCFSPRFSYSIVVRLGLQTGAILALMFSLLLIPSTSFLPWMCAVVVAPVLGLLTWSIGKLARKRFTILYLLILTTVVAGLCSLAMAIYQADPQYAQIFITVAMFIVGSAPVLGMVSFLRASRASYFLVNPRDNIESSSSDHKTKMRANRWRIAAGWITWSTAMYWSWKIALQTQAIEYAKLPTSDPNCYVSSAAAHGHPRWVGSKSTDLHLDSAPKVNLQMKRLKFLELGLRVLAPGIHARIRLIYNSIGPQLARRCKSNIWFADLTFLALKPIEWAAITVRALSGIPRDTVDALYSGTDI